VSSRERILAALRAGAPAEAPLPDLSRLGASYPDLRARFAQACTEVGGKCVRLPAGAPLEEALLAIPEYAAARKVASLAPGAGARANVDPEAVADPHDLQDLDFLVLRGELGVAENGAVWVTRHGGRGRSGVFLTQHLAIVLSGEALVADLHAAYQRIQIPNPGFGLWMSGPSKTADIEQALVIGAHGARSSTVLLVG
jgi:L-lactate dehydrogenase complex protein LldG